MRKKPRELQQKIADLCGLRQEAISISRIGDDGNFGATVIAGVTGVRDRAQQDIERICGQLRSKYKLAKF
jgi:hypothetical protein